VRALAGQASLRKALIAAVAKSGKLDPLIAELERRKRNRTRYRPKRAAARREAMCGSVGSSAMLAATSDPLGGRWRCGSIRVIE
jgi:hypothetical protein